MIRGAVVASTPGGIRASAELERAFIRLGAHASEPGQAQVLVAADDESVDRALRTAARDAVVVTLGEGRAGAVSLAERFRITGSRFPVVADDFRARPTGLRELHVASHDGAPLGPSLPTVGVGSARVFDRAEVLRSSAVFIHRHGSPASLLVEALAAGCACVIAGPDPSGVARHEHNALLVPAATDLTAAASRLLGDAELRASLSRAGERSAMLFSATSVAVACLALSRETPAELGSQQVTLDADLAVPRVALPADAVTVAIPIFNAFDETRRCISSVLANTPEPHFLLLCDDASDDEQMAPFLAGVARAHGHVEVMRASRNRGYTATINTACERAPADIVLLNSDTEVSSGWLSSLRSVAHSQAKVATVTPVSNAAGAFNVPKPNHNWDLPRGVTASDMAAYVRRVSSRVRPAVPTGNGFCMYIRRDALDEVGGFDEAAFPRGYGEENDFCLRAGAAGYVNLIDDATFVYHKRSASFGAEKQELVAHAISIVRERYPDYQDRVRELLADDALDDLRAQVDAALSAGTIHRPPARPRVLFIMQSGGGGAPQANADLMASIADAYEPLLMLCAVDGWTIHRGTGDQAVLAELPFGGYWDPAAPLDNAQRTFISRVCRDHQIDLVHLRSFLANAPELADVVADLGLPLVVSFHDYYAVCPTIKLLDADERYCAGHCTAGNVDCSLSASWFRVRLPKQVKHGWVHDWRARLRPALQRADAFVTTSQTARTIIADHYPDIDLDRFHVIPHGRDPVGPTLRAETPQPWWPKPRIATYGLLAPAKGTALITELLKRNVAAGSPLEFHFIGDQHGSFTPEQYGGISHGPYKREDLLTILAGLKANFALVCPIQPETYCHTLTEAWHAGLPVFASDMGTVKERVEADGGGWLLDPSDPDAWFDEMLRVAREPGEWQRARDQIESMNLPTVDDMARAYREIYRSLLTSGG